MPVRVQVILDETEKEAFERRAAAEGVSLSRWFRDAGRARLSAAGTRQAPSPAALRRFFAACDAREKGREPEWHEHLSVIASSRARGGSAT